MTAGKKMIAIAHAMAMAVPKPPADPLAARGCPASMRSVSPLFSPTYLYPPYPLARPVISRAT